MCFPKGFQDSIQSLAITNWRLDTCDGTVHSSMHSWPSSQQGDHNYDVFHDSLKISKFTRICMENHSSVTGWQKVAFPIQIFLIFGGRCNCYFWDIWLKIYRLPNLNMHFQLVLTKCFKIKLFSCLLKVDPMINCCKRPIERRTLNFSPTIQIIF